MQGRPFAGGATAALLLISLAVSASPADAAGGSTVAAPAVAAGPVAAVAAGPGHDKIVSAVPDQNPYVHNGSVWAFAEVGDQMVVGGSFSQVSSRNSDVVLTRSNIFVFDEATGQVSTTVVPNLNGKVEYLQVGPVPGTVFAAGAFTQLNGANVGHLVLIDVNTGLAVPSFKAASTNGVVNDLRLVGNRLYAGGFFTSVGGVAHRGLAAFNATTGKLDPFMNVQLAEHHNNTGTGAQGSIGAKSMDVTPDGTQLVVIGNFRTADGLPRDQVVLIDLTGSSAAVRTDWRTRRYEPYCAKGAFDSYMRGVDFSPDGSFFIIVTTGGPNTGTLCDTAARWQSAATGDAVEPFWVDETGGDTLWSVEITEQAAYIGGHNRWFNNPSGRDNAGAGAVPRPGISALDVRTGLPLAWDPGRNPRGVSAFELYATSTGLWVGQDTDWIGNRRYNRGKLAYFPLSTGYRVAPDAAPVLPGTAYLAAKQVTDNGRVLFRVNAGGPQVTSQDISSNWLVDTSSTSLYHTSGNSAATYPPSVALSPSVPAGTPTALFDSERFDTNSGSPDMDWSFPVAAGAPLEVRLYFANRCSCSSSIGQRKFNVSIDNVLKLNNYDIVADVGNGVGTMKSFPITSDGTVNINFDRLVGNPVVNAIEIVRTDRPEAPPSSLDDVPALGFNGTTATSPTTVASGGVSWRNARGAFWLDGKLFNGWSDGTFTSRSFDGSTFGPPTVLAPWADPKWAGVDTGSGNTFDGKPSGLVAELPNVTGMFYLDGRIYYTLSGSSTLFWRWFSPDSGIVGAVRNSAPAGFNFADIRGMFYSGGNIYAALSSNGDLVRISFTGGAPSSTATTITGPSTGGTDWRSRAMFMIGAPPNQPPSASFTTSCADQTCSVDATASSDADGSITSYAWNFGDNTTDTGVTPAAHAYAVPGTYVVTLTVTDDDGLSSSTTRSVQAVAPNVGPNAAFTIDCAGLLCAVDGRGSTDSDGTVTSYTWDFGDGGSASGAERTHRYTSAGTYDITLTVTDDDGVPDDLTQQIVVAEAPEAIRFVARSTAASNVAATRTTIPAAAQAGDTALLLVTHNVNDPGFTAPTGVAGWAQVESRTTTGMTTTLWSKVLEASDPGALVTVTANRDVRAVMTVSVWKGADPLSPVSAEAGSVDASTASHTTPTMQAANGDWVVSYWSDKSSTTTTWTGPDDVQVRGSTIGSGAGRVTSLLADSGVAVPKGPVGGETATTDAPSTRGINMTVLLSPPPPNRPPTAAFASACTNQTCEFDGSESSDPDGSIVSYVWDFADGQNDVGVSPQHLFEDPGSYEVVLTVTDNDGEARTVTHTVSVQAPHIEAIAAASAKGTLAAVSVQVPAAAAAGDTAVLLSTHSAVDPNLTALPGWTLEDTRTSGGMVSNVWSRELTTDDPGSTVTVTADRALKTTLALAVYRGAANTTDGVRVTSAAEGSTATHTTPTVTTTAPTWVLSYFADKSTGTTAWTQPPAAQTRAEAYTVGSGRVTSLLVDAGDAVPAGTVGGYAASTDVAGTRAVVMTIVLDIAP